MAVGLLGAAAISGAGSLISTGINAAISNYNWKKQVAHEQATYDRNRADYLADLANERAYNSPQAVIDRIREAGLNPNLINGGQLISGQMSSGAQTMPVGSEMSPDSITMDNPMSGVPAFSNAISNRMEANARIANLESRTTYQNIINKYQDEASRLGNKVTAANYDQIVQKIAESASNITLNQSKIDVNNKQIELFDSQMTYNLSASEKLIAEKSLAEAKTAIAKLDAQKAQILMPFVAAREAASIALTNAQTNKEKAAAMALFAQKDLALAEAAVKNGLISEGYASTYVSSLKKNAEAAMKNADSNWYNAETNRKSFINDCVQQSITNGFDTAKKVLHFIPGGKYIW